MNTTARWTGALLLSFAFVQQKPTTAQEATSIPPQGDIEVQTRGPLHEAFALPFDPNPGPGEVVPKEPPPPIPEVAPDQRPEGDNVQWIGGYWAWDADRNDFIWVSGTYRNAPAGRQFVPGHWANTEEGWRWVEGFWAPDSQNELPYVEQPPAPLETQPALPPPDANSTYVPGYWSNQDSTYAWRPGFYSAIRPGRIWVAPRYVWTPAGYIFVNGYWDYPLDNRGLVFAPVWFNRPLWRTAGWAYRPGYVVAANALLDSLFWRGNHYYFGNYYGPGYARLGFQPWFARGFDPLFNYHRWNNRGNPNWLAGQQHLFNQRNAGLAATPPRTFAQQTAGNRTIAPLAASTNRLTNVTPAQAAHHRASLQRQQEFVQARNQRESVRSNNPRAAGNALKTPARTPALSSSSFNAARLNGNGITTRPTGKSDSHGLAELKGLNSKLAGSNGVVVRDFNRHPGTPHVVNQGGTPRVLNSFNSPTPRVVHNSSANATKSAPAASLPRSTVAHNRPVTTAQRHVSPAVSHAGRTVNHAPARSAPARSGGGGHRGRR